MDSIKLIPSTETTKRRRGKKQLMFLLSCAVVAALALSGFILVDRMSKARDARDAMANEVHTAIAAGDWARAQALLNRLASNYPHDPVIVSAQLTINIGRDRALKEQSLQAAISAGDWVRAENLLAELGPTYPGSADARAKITKGLEPSDALREAITKRVAQFWNGVKHRSVSGVVDLYSKADLDYGYGKLYVRLTSVAVFPDQVRELMTRLTDPAQIQTCKLALLLSAGDTKALRSEYERMLAEEIFSRFPSPVTDYEIQAIRQRVANGEIEVEMSYTTRSATNAIKQIYWNENGKWVLKSAI